MNKSFLLIMFIVFSFSANMVCAAQNTKMLAMETMISKFSISMLGICVFSIVIYCGLTIYNKFFVAPQIRNYKIKQYSLKTPEDTEEAIYLFIEKNRLL